MIFSRTSRRNTPKECGRTSPPPSSDVSGRPEPLSTISSEEGNEWVPIRLPEPPQPCLIQRKVFQRQLETPDYRRKESRFFPLSVFLNSREPSPPLAPNPVALTPNRLNPPTSPKTKPPVAIPNIAQNLVAVAALRALSNPGKVSPQLTTSARKDCAPPLTSSPLSIMPPLTKSPILSASPPVSSSSFIFLISSPPDTPTLPTCQRTLEHHSPNANN